MYEVKQDFALADFMVTKCSRDKYRRGYAFYELTDKKEDVHDGKEIIVYDKVLLNYQSPVLFCHGLNFIIVRHCLKGFYVI